MPDLPAAHRLRVGRYAEASRIYLLTTNTHQRKQIFKDFPLGSLVVDQFRNAQNSGLANSLAWVVMPDHFHWLVELQQGSLSELMQKTKSLSTKAVRQVTGDCSPLWQRGFHDRALRQERGMWWPTHCGLAWWKSLATIPCGMRFGFEPEPWCLDREQAHSYIWNAFPCRSEPARDGVSTAFSPAHTPSTPTG